MTNIAQNCCRGKPTGFVVQQSYVSAATVYETVPDTVTVLFIHSRFVIFEMNTFL